MIPGRWRALAASFVALAGCRLEVRQPVLPADLVLRGARIYTMSSARSWATALAARDGRVVYVGDDSTVGRYLGRRTRVVDLQGRLVLPGFQDTHVHPLAGGLELGECDLHGASTQEEVGRRIREYAENHPELPWIRGNGWALPVFPGASPRRELLDDLVPGRPAFLQAADGHSAWVNTPALATAGIDRTTPDPPNGRIERDPVTGEPSGTLREAAMDLVASHLPPYSPAERQAAVRHALAEANRFGITSVTDADAEEDDLKAYRAVALAEGLNARVTAAIHTEPDEPIEEAVARAARLRTRYVAPRLAVNTVKLFADGVIESRTAAMLEPYLDGRGSRGELNYDESGFKRRIVAFDRAGFQIHIHAIGDRAVRVSLDALELARKVNGPRDARPVMAHLEVVEPEDLPRFRDLGVVASIQPYWAQADPYIRRLTIPALGSERSRWLYPFHSLLVTGAVMAAGSDWTVSSLNPLDAMQVAATRQGLRETPGEGWIPVERLDLASLIAMYTINAAYATRAERETGSLEVGKLADLVVLDRNIFDLPLHRVHTARVLLTFLEGREVWRAGERAVD